MITLTCYGVSSFANGKQVTVELKPDISEQNYWQTSYFFNVDLSTDDLDEYCISLEMEAEQVWSLTPDRHLVEIHSKLKTPFVVGRFFIVKNSQGLFKIDLPWAIELHIAKRSDSVEIKTRLRNKLGCGFRIWGSDKITPSKRKHVLQILKARLNALSECVWLEPYPQGARAVLCLTDHADFDSVEKLELLSELFIKHDLKVTKSVFPHSDPRQKKNEPGLDNSEYRKLIEKLYEHGNEIAYHGLSPRVNAPSHNECKRRADIMKRFNPKTWTDHGSGSYLFSRKETLDDGTRLTDFLSEYGIRNYWSYFDIWNNPFNDLACEHPRSDFEIVKDLSHSLGLLKSMSPLKVAYIFSHSLNNFFSEKTMQNLMNSPMNLNHWWTAFRDRKYLLGLKTQPQILYGRDGTCFALNLDEPWIFDTVLLNHLAFQLQPSMINRLCHEAGFLIVHCYFCAQHPYMTDNCFKNNVNICELLPEFVIAVENIAKRQQEREIATLPFYQLREILSGFTTSSLLRTHDGWRLQKHLPGDTVIAGDKSFISSSLSNDTVQWCKDEVGYLALPKKNGVEIKFAALVCA